ncbi:MAG: SPASM domain-containing protein [Bacilli bacterium]|nr:SPASM domain-containing protein [Bacilli bacterium]
MKQYKKIYIEITNICNLNCSFCSKTSKKKKNMTLEEFQVILEKIKDYTNYIYLHIKGEPLLHPQVIDFMKEAEKYHIKVNLTTNGTLLKEKAKCLGSCQNLNKINVSLHCEQEDPNYFKDIFDSIQSLSPKTTVIYRLWTLKNNQLDKKSTEIVDKIKEYYHLSTETVDKIKKENNIKINPQIYVDKDNEFEWPHITTHQSRGYCYALKTQIGILVDGTVVPCCLDAEGIINLGNIFQEDLEDIINSTRYQTLQKSFQDRNPSEALCRSCMFKEKRKES